MEKKNIVVLFGGQSSEHVVSCMSVQNVAANINEEKYNVILVGITEDGHWVKVDSLSQVKDDTWRESKAGAVLSPDAKEKCLISGGIAVREDMKTQDLRGNIRSQRLIPRPAAG